MKTLKQLGKPLKLEYVNENITEKNFPAKVRGTDFKIFKMDKDFTLEEAIAHLDKQGYLPCNAHELLTWAKEWNGKDTVLALGEEWQYPYGDRGVMCLYEWDDERRLGLRFVDGGWYSLCLVAGIKQVSGTVGKLDSGLTLGSLDARLSRLENLFNPELL